LKGVTTGGMIPDGIIGGLPDAAGLRMQMLLRHGRGSHPRVPDLGR
jgi:hypothetical protein